MLDFAIQSKKQPLEILDFLIENGAEILFGSLILTIQFQNFETLKFLIEKKSVNFLNEQQRNFDLALCAAIQSENIQILNYLVDNAKQKPFDLNSTINNDGCTPLWLSSCFGNLKMVKFLFKKQTEYGSILDVNKSNSEGQSPLWIAAKVRNALDIVKFLIEKGANVDHADGHGITPVFVASSEGNLEVLKFLTEKGCDLEKTSASGRTPLWIACKLNRSTEIVRYLLEKGVDSNTPDFDKISPVWIASFYGHLNIVECLVEEGFVDVNMPNESGMTPLYVAADRGNFEIVKYLVEKAKADCRLKTKHGRTPYRAAFEGGHKKISDFLLKKT